MKTDSESVARERQGRRGSAAAGAAEAAPIRSLRKNFMVRLEGEELMYVLAMLEGHRSYYEMLSKHPKCSEHNRRRGELVKGIWEKLEELREEG